MRFHLPILHRLSDALRKRDWFGIGFELFVVVLGVMLGIQASRWTAERENREYRRQIIGSLDRTLGDYEYEGRRMHDHITASLDEYKRRTAAGEHPAPPVFVLPGLERAPTRAWEAMVETGVARSIEPALLFRLALLFDRADSWGDKYERYNFFTEQQVTPFKNDEAHFYSPNGSLKPAFAAHIGQLSDLLALSDQMGKDAVEIRQLLKTPNAAKAGNLSGPDLPMKG